MSQEEEAEKLREALWKIAQWARAYPVSMFSEPDLRRAAELLKAGGITLDAVSGTVARHVVEGIGKIANEALEERHEREQKMIGMGDAVKIGQSEVVTPTANLRFNRGFLEQEFTVVRYDGDRVVGAGSEWRLVPRVEEQLR